VTVNLPNFDLVAGSGIIRLFRWAGLEVVTMSRETDATLMKRLRDDPDRRVDIIVTVKGDPLSYVSQLRALDLEVKRTFSLVQKMALGGPARSVVALSDESWVTKIEEDKPVQALDGDHHQNEGQGMQN
jgi:hypothetical protein